MQLSTITAAILMTAVQINYFVYSKTVHFNLVLNSISNINKICKQRQNTTICLDYKTEFLAEIYQIYNKN